jgi:hypothetical protein
LLMVRAPSVVVKTGVEGSKVKSVGLCRWSP